MGSYLTFKDWDGAGGRPVGLVVTAAVRTDESTIWGFRKGAQGVTTLEYPSMVAGGRVMKLGFPGMKDGHVTFSLTVQTRGLGADDVTRTWDVGLKFSCTLEGKFELDPVAPIRRRVAKDRMLTADILVYRIKRTPDYLGTRCHDNRIPLTVFNEWMKQINLLRFEIYLRFRRLTDPSGEDFVWGGDGPPSFTASPPGTEISSGDLLGPFIIDFEPVDDELPVWVAPPIDYNSWTGNTSVFFDVGSAEIDKVVDLGRGMGSSHQGRKLDDWIEAFLISRWDIFAALEVGKLPLHGKARASATWAGLSPAERKKANQKLSEDRLAAVKDRLSKTLKKLRPGGIGKVDMSQIAAVGDREAPVVGEEDSLQRVVDISIDDMELRKAIKELFGRKYSGWVCDKSRY